MAGRSIKAPPLFFAPAVSSIMTVEPAWIDYNGHLNVAYYNVLFDRAIDEIMLNVGLGPDYLATRGGSYFAAEAHLRYERELMAQTPVRVTFQLIDVDEKRIHYFMELRHAHEGWIAATMEGLSLHIDMRQRRVTPFPADILTNLMLMKAAHARIARPKVLGKVIAIKAQQESENVPSDARPPLLN